MFSLGSCLFFIIFKQEPYRFISKVTVNEVYKYELDLGMIDEI